jgi:hypothetical protein
LRKIREACQIIKSTDALTQEISLTFTSLIPAKGAPPTGRDIEIICRFLDRVVKVCFPEANIFAVLSCKGKYVETSSYFGFGPEQLRYIQHSLMCYEDISPIIESTARKALIPIFVRLNATLKTTSYFWLTYNADWDQISTILSDLPEDLEILCIHAGKSQQYPDHDVFSAMRLRDQLLDEPAVARLERLTERLESIQSRIASTSATSGPKGRRVWLRRKRCKCDGTPLPDELQKAFEAASYLKTASKATAKPTAPTAPTAPSPVDEPSPPESIIVADLSDDCC